MAELTGRALIASRCAKFFKNGDFVNLGIGVPLMCVNYLPEGVELWLEAEIGTVGSGPSPSWDDVDIDCIDAGGQPASIIPGGSVYDNETSFMFIRGGHIDAAVLGTLQVDQEGSIANWTIPGKLVPGMGGAMLAMVACGAYPSVQAVCDKLVKVADTVRPDPEIAARYEQRYQQFAKIYPALKGLYPQLL